MIRVFALALAFLAATTAAEEYLINAQVSSTYTVWVVDSNRDAVHQISTPSGYSHTVWPSGVIAADGSYHVFASVRATAYNEVAHWKTTTSPPATWWTDLSYQGIVFAANGTEPNGIGPTHVSYVPGSGPFVMIYLVRGASGPGASLKTATSTDGTTWVRQGTTYSGFVDGGTGLTMSYACELDDGQVAIFLSEYSTFEEAFGRAIGVVAIAPDWGTTAGTGFVTIEPDGNAGTASGVAGNSFITGVVPLTSPAAFWDSFELFDPVSHPGDGTTVISQALTKTHPAGSTWRSIARRKIEHSFADQRGDHTWAGPATGYNPANGTNQEHTVNISAVHLNSSWQYDGRLFVNQFAGGLESAENPTPVRDNARCRPGPAHLTPGATITGGRMQ